MLRMVQYFVEKNQGQKCIHFYGIGIGRQKRAKFNELQKASKVAAAARFKPRKMSDRQLRAANLHLAHTFNLFGVFPPKKKIYIYI